SKATADQVESERKNCVAISPESASVCAPQAPRTYNATLRSCLPLSPSRAAALNPRHCGGTNKAEMASNKVDLPDPERPKKRKPFLAIVMRCRSENVPQL